MAIRVWTRWKAFAHRAAEFQANVLFLLLYFAGVIPIRALGLDQSGGKSAASVQQRPHWSVKEPMTCDLSWARRQF
jgi:hypothetical protein